MHQDGDGYGLGCALGDDCNDSDPGINPGALDLCGDGVDQDCDNDTDDLVPDNQGELYCFQVEPFDAVIGSEVTLNVRAYHESGLEKIVMERNKDNDNKIVLQCGGASFCMLSETVLEEYETTISCESCGTGSTLTRLAFAKFDKL